MTFDMRLAATALFLVCLQNLAAPPQRCKELITRVGESTNIYMLTGHERSLKDVKAPFKSILDRKPFELIIRKATKLNLFPVEPRHRVRHSAGKVDYFPYELTTASTDDSKYIHDQLSALERALYSLERAQKTGISLGEVWPINYKGRVYFQRSPTTATSNFLFQRPDRLRAIIERGQRLGRFPFLYKQKNGDMVLTNKHFLTLLRAQGYRFVTLYRGQHSFDHFFFRLLLGENAETVRIEFAEWLEREIWNVSYARGIDKNTVENIIDKLRNKRVPVPIEEVLSELSQQATTSAMFTSLTDDHSSYWAHGKNSEILTLKLDLKTIPDWYLEQIMYGADLDVEIVFPFATKAQREALRSSLKIENSQPVLRTNE